MWQVGVIAFIVALAILLLSLGQVSQAKQTLQVKADVIALGAAQVLVENFGSEKAPQLACQEAFVLAKYNRVEIIDCVASKMEIWVFIRKVIYDFNVFSFSHAGITTDFEHK